VYERDIYFPSCNVITILQDFSEENYCPFFSLTPS